MITLTSGWNPSTTQLLQAMETRMTSLPFDIHLIGKAAYDKCRETRWHLTYLVSVVDFDCLMKFLSVEKLHYFLSLTKNL